MTVCQKKNKSRIDAVSTASILLRSDRISIVHVECLGKINVETVMFENRVVLAGSDDCSPSALARCELSFSFTRGQGTKVDITEFYHHILASFQTSDFMERHRLVEKHISYDGMSLGTSDLPYTSSPYRRVYIL
ncbi:hypothetical protein EVAR_36790_1 [Eumeta japonica]|uniref:Uncharacterized protein n=1 Tax=Eumeta variegata TaxID=151549 RepID=A0A4C1WUV6_EUMVA|nr:hypothetical protein EVAR_36790_1 [Eumeta japonica]